MNKLVKAGIYHSSTKIKNSHLNHIIFLLIINSRYSLIYIKQF